MLSFRFLLVVSSILPSWSACFWVVESMCRTPRLMYVESLRVDARVAEIDVAALMAVLEQGAQGWI